MPQYKLEEGNLQHRFQMSRAKVQLFGGGFANGKTTAAVVKALGLCKDYPGSNGLIARSTYPKLNDTIRKEFIKWCPANWIARKALSIDNVIELTNGTVINFRYIAQQGKSNESSTSNLLSATYDWIVVDQIEDPEISEKDFLDLLGRLRGNTPYVGVDPTMPTSGPRWFICMSNPTRNWVFRKLVKPIQDLQLGIRNPDLLVDVKTGEPMMELFEGSTYENKSNLADDYIETLEGAYTGQMRTRYLLGQWGAFEGLVYPQYDPSVHMLSTEEIWDYLEQLIEYGFRPTFLEAYDHGIAKEACYLLAFADHKQNVFILDGFYQKERTIEQLVNGNADPMDRFDGIKGIRGKLYSKKLIGSDHEWEHVLADPAVFRRASGNAKTVGVSVAGMFSELGIDMQQANNDIVGGIAKVQSYLTVDKAHEHPIGGTYGSPRLYFNNDLAFIDSEFVDYYWKKDTAGQYEDIPNDRTDHAMDAIKYLLSRRPRIAAFVVKPKELPIAIMRWGERELMTQNMRNPRHGN